MLGWAVACLSILGATAEQDLVTAEKALEAYDYATAARTLEGVRERLDELPGPRAVDALRASAVAALSLDNLAEAEDHLLALLLRAPDFGPLPGAWPPAWIRVYEAARDRIPDRYPPEVRLKLPAEGVDEHRPYVLRATVTDPSGVRRVAVILEREALELAMTSTTGASYAVTIPAKAVRAPAVRFWVEAFDAYGNGPGYLGRSRAPSALPVIGAALATEATAKADSTSVTDEWWFWVVAGVVVAGAGVSVAVIATRDGEPERIVGSVRFP